MSRALAFLACALLAGRTVAVEAATSGLMVHVPLDGTVTDARRLGAVRAEPEARPVFVPGVAGDAALPAPGRRHVGMLYVSRLSWLLLGGRTPETGTIMLWVKMAALEAAGIDSSRVLVLSSDPPLNLDVEIGSRPRRLIAAFDDEAGLRHRIETGIALPDEWVHIALGWDASAGAAVAFVQGEPRANDSGPAFRMPRLPRVFALGASETPIDDFRLYDRLLDAATLATLPGLAGSAR